MAQRRCHAIGSLRRGMFAVSCRVSSAHLVGIVRGVYAARSLNL